MLSWTVSWTDDSVCFHGLRSYWGQWSMLWSRKEKKYLIIFDKYCPIPRFLIATAVYVIFSHLFDHLSEVQIKGVFNGNFRIIYCDFSIATCCGYSLESSCILGNHFNHLVTRTHYKYYLYGKLKRITIKNPFHPLLWIIWAPSWENLSSGFATRVDSNWSAQPQKLGGIEAWNFGFSKYRYYNKHRTTNCEDVQADLRLCCSHMA